MNKILIALAAMTLPMAAQAGFNCCENQQQQYNSNSDCVQVYTFDVDCLQDCMSLDCEQPNIVIDIDAPACTLDVPAPRVELEVERPQVQIDFCKPQIEMLVTQPKIEYCLKKPSCSCDVSQPRINMCVHPTPACNMHVSKPRCSMSCGQNDNCGCAPKNCCNQPVQQDSCNDHQEHYYNNGFGF